MRSHYGRHDHRGYAMPVKLLSILALAVSLHAEDAKPFLFTLDQATVNNITGIAFYCELNEQAEEQGFKDCGDLTVPGYYEAAPDWQIILDVSISCPLDEATFVFSSGPVNILWPAALVFDFTSTHDCAVKPWLYYHVDWDGGFVGLRLDPETQKLSIEQSEVTFR